MPRVDEQEWESQEHWKGWQMSNQMNIWLRRQEEKCSCSWEVEKTRGMGWIRGTAKVHQQRQGGIARSPLDPRSNRTEWRKVSEATCEEAALLLLKSCTGWHLFSPTCRAKHMLDLGFHDCILDLALNIVLELWTCAWTLDFMCGFANLCLELELYICTLTSCPGCVDSDKSRPRFSSELEE